MQDLTIAGLKAAIAHTQELPNLWLSLPSWVLGENLGNVPLVLWAVATLAATWAMNPRNTYWLSRFACGAAALSSVLLLGLMVVSCHVMPLSPALQAEVKGVLAADELWNGVPIPAEPSASDVLRARTRLRGNLAELDAVRRRVMPLSADAVAQLRGDYGRLPVAAVVSRSLQ